MMVNVFCQKELLGFDSQMGTVLPKDSCRKSVLVSYNLHCRNSAAGAAVLSAEAFYGLVY